MMPLRDMVEAANEGVMGAGLFIAERIMGNPTTEEGQCRRTHIIALPVVTVMVVVTAVGMTAVGAGRLIARPIDDGVELIAELVNIHREMVANNEGPGKPFQRYEGPQSFVRRTALGIIASPIALVARLALPGHRPAY